MPEKDRNEQQGGQKYPWLASSRNYSQLTQIERSEIMLRAQDLKISAKRGPLIIKEVLQELGSDD
ncbi:MAG: hypothetical protein QOD84_765 [Acidobacteriaceae bacterium]